MFFVSLLQVSSLPKADSEDYNLPNVAYNTFIEKCTTQDPKVWQFAGKKGGVERYFSTNFGSTGYYTARGIVDVDDGTPEEVCKAACYSGQTLAEFHLFFVQFKNWIFNFDKKRKLWDANFVKGYEIKRFSNYMTMSYMQCKLPSIFLQDRDMVLIRGWKQMSDGSPLD